MQKQSKWNTYAIITDAIIPATNGDMVDNCLKAELHVLVTAWMKCVLLYLSHPAIYVGVNQSYLQRLINGQRQNIDLPFHLHLKKYRQWISVYHNSTLKLTKDPLDPTGIDNTFYSIATSQKGIKAKWIRHLIQMYECYTLVQEAWCRMNEAKE